MKEELPVKIVCPFCNAAYSAKMEAELINNCSGCETCGCGSPDGVMTITCDNCGKIVYKKEYSEHDN